MKPRICKRWFEVASQVWMFVNACFDDSVKSSHKRCKTAPGLGQLTHFYCFCFPQGSQLEAPLLPYLFGVLGWKQTTNSNDHATKFSVSEIFSKTILRVQAMIFWLFSRTLNSILQDQSCKPSKFGRKGNWGVGITIPFQLPKFCSILNKDF